MTACAFRDVRHLDARLAPKTVGSAGYASFVINFRSATRSGQRFGDAWVGSATLISPTWLNSMRLHLRGLVGCRRA